MSATSIIVILVVLLLVAFFSLLFVLALRRFLRLPGQEVDETRESIISRELLLSQLKNLFARPRPARPAPPPPPKTAAPPPLPPPPAAPPPPPKKGLAALFAPKPKKK